MQESISNCFNPMYCRGKCFPCSIAARLYFKLLFIIVQKTREAGASPLPVLCVPGMSVGVPEYPEVWPLEDRLPEDRLLEDRLLEEKPLEDLPPEPPIEQLGQPKKCFYQSLASKKFDMEQINATPSLEQLTSEHMSKYTSLQRPLGNVVAAGNGVSHEPLPAV